MLYDFTPLIRPLALNVENQGACDTSILSISVILLVVVKQPIYFTTVKG